METSTASARNDAVKTALIDLYLSVKVRKAEEIDKFDVSALDNERDTLKDVDPLLIIGYTKTSIEILMNIRNEEQEQLKQQQKENESLTSEIATHDPPKKYEEMLQKLEDEVRTHIRVRLPSRYKFP